jgi:hypothetical protein
MLLDKLMHHDPVDGFRWRSHEITRVEGFSDAVFGFAVTLLIVSLEVPKTSAELFETMHGFGAFVATFIILAGIWYAQFTFFRRYGLEDRVTVLLNLVLLFTVLFFVYPLKFLFGVLLSDPLMRQKIVTAHGLVPVVPIEHRPWIFFIFAIGFMSVFTVFTLLYWHAYRQRETLGLNEFEVWETRHSLRRMALSVLVGVMYFGVAFMHSLPRKTAADRMKVEIVSWTILVFFFAIFAIIFRMLRQRRRVRKEWKARQAEPVPESPPQA